MLSFWKFMGLRWFVFYKNFKILKVENILSWLILEG